MRFAISAALLLAGSAAAAAPQQTYFVQAGTAGCTRAEQLATVPTSWSTAAAQHAIDYAKKACRYLPANTAVQWSGARIDGFSPRYIGGDVARVTADGRVLFVYANFLQATRWSDPVRRDYRIARASFGCQWHSRFAEGLLAFGARDLHWLHRIDCTTVPAGIAAIRIEPALATPDSPWRMHIRFPQGGETTLWMDRSALL